MITINVAMENGFLTADEAAARLNVKRATVYAYVSRGMLKRQSLDGMPGSYFDAMEVERLADRGRKSLKTGRPSPAFKSAITTFGNGDIYYRGHRACRLAETERFESVAHLLWQDALRRDAVFNADPTVAGLLRQVGDLLPEGILPFERAKALVPVAATLDPMRHDLSTIAAVRRVSTLMATLIDALPAQSAPAAGAHFDFAARMWSRLAAGPPAPSLLAVLNAALVLTADADVTSPTTLAARMGASVRADIYSAITAGMHCSGGAIQSASSLAVESYLETLDGQRSIGEVVGERLRQGDGLPGFGHGRFPDGDPRARLILDMLARSDGDPSRVARLGEFLEIQRNRGIAPPNIGFAIAALAYVAGMVRGSGDLIFAMARTAGWAAHAIEQYNSDQEMRRPPSLYIGRPPATD
ncbi:MULTISPECIES: citrate synthase [unclassified Roseitalea]|uniref:citrate synthase n=1 Tax=unclassified Roseitalea TaxID=2639107 RepID=UPI00273DCAAE|nr:MULTISPECIES: citrate synthase [unclassified Roseitalea]